MKKFFKNTFRFIGALLALVRGITLLAMIAIVVVTVYFIYTAAHITINQYNESLVWENTAYEAPMSEIEPALVANVVNTETVDAAAAWEALEAYVNDLDGSPITDRKTAEDLLENAVHWQEIYNLKSDAIERLSLYLDLEDAITEAYATFDTTKLKELTQKLYNMEMEETTKSGQQYMERIRGVSADFAQVKDLMTNTVWSIGEIEDGVWTIPYTYTRTDLENVLAQMDTMQKFSAIDHTADMLSDISDVLNHNKNAADYFTYLDFKNTINTVNHSQYVAVSSIDTYEQALAFGCIMEPPQQAGYTVSLSSPVTGIYYEGERLDSSEYIKRGTPVTADIDPVYDPVPVVMEPMPIDPVYVEPEPVADPEYSEYDIPVEGDLFYHE